MKRTILFLLSIFVSTVIMVSCSFSHNYTYLHSEEMIVGIELVQFEIDNSDYTTFPSQKNIEDVDGFLSDFNRLDFYKSSLGPVGIVENSLVIKIVYENGDFELVHYNGQAKYTCELGSSNYCGRGTFEKEQFNALIEKYR